MKDTMQHCPSCKKKMPDYARFCGHCGCQINDAPGIRNTMHPCLWCEKKMPDYAHFCGNCGRQLNNAPVKMLMTPLSSIQRHSTDVPSSSRIAFYHKVLNKLPRP